MTLLIDTEAKTVTLMGDVLLCDLYWFLMDAFKDVDGWTIVTAPKADRNTVITIDGDT